MVFKKFISSLFLVLSLFTLASCGKDGSISMVKGLNVHTSVVNGEVHLQITSDFDFGNVYFPSVQFPILKDGAQVGSVSIIPVLGSKTQLVIDMDAGSLSSLPTGSVTLPNGMYAPLIGANPGITVDLGSNAELYIAAAANAYAVGVAIPISGFDGLSSSVGSLNFFPMFALDKTTGAAGIFTSTTAGKSGFAFFVDLTPYMADLQLGNVIADATSSLMQQEVYSIALDRTPSMPSASKEAKLKSILYDWNKRKVHLKR